MSLMLFADTANVAAWQQLLGLAIIIGAICAVVREWEVRIVLSCAALALGLIVGAPDVIVREFLSNFINEKFVIPLCCGMGFAQVLRHTGCDKNLVHLLVHPLSKVRFLLVPGTVLVGFLVNMPIVSQSSTAVTIGAVIIPILRAAGLSPITTGAALLLGCSIGGELFNPAAPEVLTTFQVSQKAAKELPDLAIDPATFDASRCVQRIFPLNLIGLACATITFWIISLFREQSTISQNVSKPAETVPPPHELPAFGSFAGVLFLLRAIVPLFPLVFLYLCSYPFNFIEVDRSWLVSESVPADRAREIVPTRLIGLAMIMGVVAAVMVSPSKFKGAGMAFFEGAGFGFGHIVSLILVAQGFAKGIELVGFAQTIAGLIEAFPQLLIPLAGILALGFAFLCGSGTVSYTHLTLPTILRV